MCRTTDDGGWESRVRGWDCAADPKTGFIWSIGEAMRWGGWTITVYMYNNNNIITHTHVYNITQYMYTPFCGVPWGWRLVYTRGVGSPAKDRCDFYDVPPVDVCRVELTTVLERINVCVCVCVIFVWLNMNFTRALHPRARARNRVTLKRCW